MGETIDYRGYSITIEYDSDAVDPRQDYDHLGMFYSWDKNKLGDQNFDRYDEVEIADIVRELGTGAIVLPVETYDYGSSGSGIRIEEMDRANGIIAITAAAIRTEYKVKRIMARVRKLARSVLCAEVEEFNQYLSGEVYGYSVNGPGIETDTESCWGFYGYDACVEAAKESADYYADHQAAETEALDHALALV